MNQMLSRQAQEIIRLAKEAAGEYRQGYVGTEHLLLGILREGHGLGARVLMESGADEYRIRQEIDRLLAARLHETWVLGRLPGTPHFRDVIRRAAEEARGMGNWQVASEHLLLALLAESGSVGCQALQALGVTSQTVRKCLVRRSPA